MVSLAAVLATLAAATAPPAQPASEQLTIYVSLPLQGPSRPRSEGVFEAIELALRSRGSKAGGHRLRLRLLDDATAAVGAWDAAQTRANATVAATDDSTIAYIGEFDSGATGNSLPQLNAAGVLQVSPANTAPGLTRGGPGTSAGEPAKYYPTGMRNYGRVIALDDTQARAQVQLMERASVGRLFVLDDGKRYGKGVATYVRRAAKRVGIAVVGKGEWNGSARRYLGLARRVVRAGADAVFVGGKPRTNAAQLLIDLYNADRRLELLAPDAMATAAFARDLPPDVQRRTGLTAPTVAPRSLPPAGRRFYRRYRERYGKGRYGIDPYAVYGYAAADAVLDAIEVGGGSRRAVVRAFFSRRQVDSVLGPYSIDANGDTTLRLYGTYGVRGGRLVFREALRP